MHDRTGRELHSRGARDRFGAGLRITGPLLALVCSAYLASDLAYDWFPWDEGGIALSAARVLSGDLPHRDFQELYTGGLTYLNAFALSLFGESFLAPRLVLLAAFGAWIWCFYELAGEFLTTPVAVATTLVAAIWSVPNYPAAVPSWYNLFFATAALFALVRFASSGGRFWLVAAGLCGGLSVLAKISGIFLILASILSLSCTGEKVETREITDRSGIGIRILHALLAAILTSLVALLVRGTQDFAFTVRYTVPVAAVGTVLIWRQVRSESRPCVPARLRRHLAVLAFYSAGALLPLLLFLLPYVASDSLSALTQGVLVKPAARLADARFAPVTDMRLILPGFAIAALVFGRSLRPPAKQIHAAVEAGLLGLLLLATWQSPLAYQLAYLTVYHAAPLLILIGCAGLILSPRGGTGDRNLYALLTVTAYASLVQIPFSSPLYFLYVAPLFLLCAAAVAARLHGPRLTLGSVASPVLFLALFGALILNRQPAFRIGTGYVPEDRFARLVFPEASLHVIERDSVAYARIDSLVQIHGAGRIGYAGPDSPEMYVFFDAPRLPFTYYDFLEPAPREGRIPHSAFGENVVIVNRLPAFSSALGTAALKELRREFPNGQTVDRFEIRWRGNE